MPTNGNDSQRTHSIGNWVTFAAFTLRDVTDDLRHRIHAQPLHHLIPFSISLNDYCNWALGEHLFRPSTHRRRLGHNGIQLFYVTCCKNGRKNDWGSLVFDGHSLYDPLLFFMMSNINDISRKYTSDDQASSVCEQYSQSKVPHLSSHHGNLESNFVARYAKKRRRSTRTPEG